MDRPGIVPIEDYLTLPRNSSTWLVKDLIPTSGSGLIYGVAKTGKSAAAIQLACALSGGAKEWLGFEIPTHGPVVYIQLDTPRSTWSLRWEALPKVGVKYDPDNLLLADRESLDFFPFDILQPQHTGYLRSLIQPIKPIAVFIDTLRKVHSGEEDNSSVMSNVVSNLIGAVHPAALILISHSRKPNFERGHDLMSDHRGSSSVTGEMDGILKMTHNKLHYGGRNIEEAAIRLEREDTGNANLLLWKVRKDSDEAQHIQQVLSDPGLNSLRSKAKALAPALGVSEEAAMSRLRRMPSPKLVVSTSGNDTTNDTPTIFSYIDQEPAKILAISGA